MIAKFFVCVLIKMMYVFLLKTKVKYSKLQKYSFSCSNVIQVHQIYLLFLPCFIYYEVVLLDISFKKDSIVKSAKLFHKASVKILCLENLENSRFLRMSKGLLMQKTQVSYGFLIYMNKVSQG